MACCLVTLTPLLTSFSANNKNLSGVSETTTSAEIRGYVDVLLTDIRKIINAVNLGRTCDPTLTPLNTLLGLVIQSYYIIIIMTYLTDLTTSGTPQGEDPLHLANMLPFISFVGNLGLQLDNILRCFCNPCTPSCQPSDGCLNSKLAPILTSLNTYINIFCNLPTGGGNATNAANAILPNLSDVINVLGPLRCDSCFLQVFNFIVKIANQLGLLIIIDNRNDPDTTANQPSPPAINSLCSLLQQLLTMLRCPLPTSTGNPCGNICNTSCDPCNNLTSKASDLFSSFFGSF